MKKYNVYCGYNLYDGTGRLEKIMRQYLDGIEPMVQEDRKIEAER